MKTVIDLDAITIDGGKLREARETRNLSVAELAALVTLSREQIKHIEEGGDRPFYTPAHKLLAVRKYANAMDLAYEDVVTGPGADQTLPAPDDAPASMLKPQESVEPADIRLAAVERNAEIRRLVLIGLIALTILLAIYAKVRGSAPEVSEEATDSEYANPLETSKAETSAPPKAQTAPARPVEPETQEITEANEITSPCLIQTGSGEPTVWSPTYQYKSDMRLFMISTKEGSICITDATGKETLLTLKPMIWQVFAGKPPYDVRAAKLSDQKLYFQGQLVKVPTDTDHLRLIPTQALPPAPATTPSAPPAPSSDTASSPEA